MLTRELAIFSINYRERLVIPDRLKMASHGHYVSYSERMVEIYNSGIGKTRKELHSEVRNIFSDEPDCPPKRIDAFCKLLDDASVYDLARGKKAPDLRIKLFKRAAEFHPLVKATDRLFDHDEADVKQRIAEDLKMTREEFESEMFADIIDSHRLKRFKGFDKPQDLLSRYNVAQVQAVLFDAFKMIVLAGKDFKTVMRYVKLARLMHKIELTGNGKYRITLDGPASVLRNTRRYGIYMAKFLPALLACSEWEMEAHISTGRKGFTRFLKLSDRDRLKSSLSEQDEFDSSFEKSFAEKWGDVRRDGWKLIREGGILHIKQKVFTPDFLLEHEDGRKVFLEIVGFWTPEYLTSKIEVLELFKGQNLLVAAAEASAKKMESLPGNIILFKSSLSLSDVLSYLSTNFPKL